MTFASLCGTRTARRCTPGATEVNAPVDTAWKPRWSCVTDPADTTSTSTRRDPTARYRYPGGGTRPPQNRPPQHNATPRTIPATTHARIRTAVVLRFGDCGWTIRPLIHSSATPATAVPRMPGWAMLSW